MFHITMDFGGTNIKIGLVRQGTVLSRTSIPAYSEGGLLPRLKDVERAVSRLLESEGLRLEECGGIGIAMPGLVNSDKLTLLSINEKYADAVGFSFGSWAEDVFGLPLVMENDARAALLGEVSYGVAQGETDAVLMTFGTGIGTAALMEGHLIGGKHYQAGVLGGHMTTDVHGRTCNCGNTGCLEAQASHRVLPEQARSLPDYSDSRLSQVPVIDYKAVVELAQAGDRVSADFLGELVMHWSAGLVNLIHAYDPEVVVLSGGLMKSAEVLLPMLEERVHRMAWTPWGKVRFKVAEDPDTSVLLGVSRLLELQRGDELSEVIRRDTV